MEQGLVIVVKCSTGQVRYGDETTLLHLQPGDTSVVGQTISSYRPSYFKAWEAMLIIPLNPLPMS
jgi:hypothetical protein